MKKYQVTWGWNPPQYDRPKGGFRLFYFDKEVEREVRHEDHETGEVTTDVVKEWKCDVVEYGRSECTDILRMLKEDKNGLEFNRWLLKAKIEAYDSSAHVNEFTIGGVSVWLDKATRSGLLLRFQSEKAMGKTETTLWYNGMKFELLIDAAIQMLYALEAYASACYDVTQMHLTFKDSTDDVELLKAYDYTSGYPEKLAF